MCVLVCTRTGAGQEDQNGEIVEDDDDYDWSRGGLRMTDLVIQMCLVLCGVQSGGGNQADKDNMVIRMLMCQMTQSPV